MTTTYIPIADNRKLAAGLSIPPAAKGLVIFAHGSGSSRMSYRNEYVAQKLRRFRLGTLLVDLLTEDEDQNPEKRFDIDLLTQRLIEITEWAAHQEQCDGLAFGYFGASTGAAAAVRAAAQNPAIKAVVSRGGRIDLAKDEIGQLTAPTLLIVGERDTGVREANEALFVSLQGEKELSIVPRATHLFEEQGALEHVADVATEWFYQYLVCC